jgi:hypothetical protein
MFLFGGVDNYYLGLNPNSGSIWFYVGMACIPIGFVVSIGVGVGLGVFWEYAIKPTVSWVYVASGFNDPYLEIRHLQSLGGN